MTVFSVTLTGGGPWGLRLIGGHNDPLIIARLRKRSKAEEAGLQEGDELVSINGQPCSSMTHNTAMTTLENSSHLTLEVANRGGSNVVPAAVPSLGTTTAPSAGYGGEEQRTSSVTMQLQTAPSGGMMNGDAYHDVQQYQTDDGAQRTINTTASTQQFGGSSITKVSREITTDYAPRVDTQPPQGLFSPVPSPRGGGSPYQAPAQQPLPYKNPQRTGGDKGRPNVWQPSGPNGANETFGAPVPPPDIPLPSYLGPKFNVRNVAEVTTQQAFSTWTPGGSIQQRVAPRPMTPPRDDKVAQGPLVWQPPRATFKDIVDTGPRPRAEPEPPQYDMGGPHNIYGDDMRDSPIYESDYRYPEYPEVIPHADINRLIREGSSDEGSRSDTPTRKKKIYADSAFYNDPEHKYPTIEEQIKMARKVAMSLTSPANKRARGHQMFNRRREKSDNWTAGMALDSEDIYYNPEPWKGVQGPQPWQPTGRSFVTPPPPPVPSLGPLDAWMAPSYQQKGEKTGSLSAEEFERMRLYEQKTLHNTVSPQVCFSLANDLRSMKGRAGEMFAKRRARADEHVVDESNVRGGGPDPKILAKLLDGRAPLPDMGLPRKETGNKDRLSEMITKPSMTPWEAALNTGGNLEGAFSHLNQKPAGYQPPQPTYATSEFSAKKIQGWAAAHPPQAPTALEQGGGIDKLDCSDFNRSARGWGGMGSSNLSSASYSMPEAASPASANNMSAQWPPSSGASEPEQWQQDQSAGAEQLQVGGAEPSGFSDL